MALWLGCGTFGTDYQGFSPRPGNIDCNPFDEDINKKKVLSQLVENIMHNTSTV